MRVDVKSGKLDDVKTDVMIIGHFEGKSALPSHLKRVDKALKGSLKGSIQSGEFKGKPNEMLILHTMGLIPASRLMLVGLGKKEKFALDVLRKAIATASKKAREISCRTVSIDIGAYANGIQPVDQISRTIVEGAMLGLYRFREYKTSRDGDGGEVRSLQIIAEDARLLADARRGSREGRIIGDSVYFVRDINNRPGNWATPEHLARQARAIARRDGLSCRVLDRRGIERLKMGGILAVGAGSRNESRLIILRHNGGRPKDGVIVLVGKGITFDSGGISIKPSLDMDKMKYDKSGGVVVMGVMSSIARLRLPVNVVGIIPAVENLPSGTAYRPGDVLKTYSGKTVEVISTDAEGRLVLADSLAYGLKFAPSVMIDIATLTGACVVALGTLAAGLMGNDDELLNELYESGMRTGERVWRLPLWEEYGELIKSDVAELKNAGGREGSAITAGYFLKEFVGNCHWAHLDIAGTAWTTTGEPDVPRGPSGMGVRLLVDFLERRAKAGRRKARGGRGA